MSEFQLLGTIKSLHPRTLVSEHGGFFLNPAQMSCLVYDSHPTVKKELLNWIDFGWIDFVPEPGISLENKPIVASKPVSLPSTESKVEEQIEELAEEPEVIEEKRPRGRPKKEE